MYDRSTLTDTQINKELLGTVLSTPLWWVLLAGALALVVAGAASSFGFMLNQGLGVTGLNRPVFWGFFITNFVFWVGISHAGVMISAILRLSHAEWRRPITRAAETMTVFALMTAALMPLIHSGRPWRTIYWAFPYDFSRGIWPDVRSPLVWDPSAIFTYLTGSILFVYTALIPDLAVLRDRTAPGSTNPSHWRHLLYGTLALGWHGNPRQWRLQALAGILLSALILPVFVSVHSIVSWDFGVSLVPSWHVTVFAPYFVIGAVHSGVAAVVTLMVIMRKLFKLQNYIKEDHFDAIGRLLIVIATAWFFFFWIDLIYAMWTRESQELNVLALRFFEPPWSWLFATFVLSAYVIPVPFWMFRRMRRNISVMLWTTILVNVGMWLERFLIIVPGLARKMPFTFDYASYRPSPVEITIVAGTFAMVAFLMLLFGKVFPLIPLWEAKEGQILKDEIQVGDVSVPAMIKE